MSNAPPEFEKLYEAEFAYVLRTLQRLGVRSSDLEDLAHDVFVTAYRRREDRDKSRPVRPWLFGIAYRVVGNHRQKAHHKREVLKEDVETPDTRPSPEEAVVQQQEREALLRALDVLDLKHRAVVVLHEIEGIAAPAIAKTLGIPLNTVYSRARNARHKLMEATQALRGEA